MAKEEEEYEHNDDEDYEYTLLRKIETLEDYKTFRRVHSLTNQVASTLLLDVTELIKKAGYKMVKE